jgi:hypothetical protein
MPQNAAKVERESTIQHITTHPSAHPDILCRLINRQHFVQSCPSRATISHWVRSLFTLSSNDPLPNAVCSPAATTYGHAHWPLRLLADRLIAHGHVDRISPTAWMSRPTPCATPRGTEPLTAQPPAGKMMHTPGRACAISSSGLCPCI